MSLFSALEFVLVALFPAYVETSALFELARLLPAEEQRASYEEMGDLSASIVFL